MWPWSELKRLREHIKTLEQFNASYLYRMELYHNMALKAIRDQQAAHKGIRRLRTRLEQARKERPR